MPKVSAASMEPCVSCPFTPGTAKTECPLRNKPRAYTGPKDRSKSIDELSRSTVKSGKRRGSTRCSTCWYATRAAHFAVGVRRSPRLTTLPYWSARIWNSILKLGWFRLSKPLHCQPEDFVLNLCFQNPPHEIPFLRPQMQQALVPLTGNGVRRLSEIEDNGTGFDDYCIARRCEEVFDRAHKGFGSHPSIVSADRRPRL